jgi:cytidyltransferase-like protein
MRVIAVFAGRFHPFHKGHASSFKQLAQKFGLDNTYLAISAKQEQPKSPFSAQDRAKMAMSLGIPSKNIIAVRNPYAAQEYIDQLNLDPEKTAIVFGVSKKDMEGEPAMGIPPDPRFSFKAKKDGNPSYLQPFNKNKVDPMSQHGYIMSTDVAEFPIAGKSMRDASAIRSAYAGADEKTKMKILTDLYGDAAEKMKQVFDNNLQITESIRRLINAIRPMLSEASFEQKQKFVKLLSEAKQRLSGTVLLENTNKFYSERQSDIIKDLGNGYFLGDDSYDDDEGFTKVGYSVYYQEGPDQFRHVDYVEMSPYRNEPGAVEASIQQIINNDSQTQVTESADYLEEK